MHHDNEKTTTTADQNSICNTLTKEELLISELLECCEEAYRKGVDSTEIYKVLHCPEITFLGRQQSRKLDLQCNNKRIHHFDKIRKIFAITIILSVLTVGVHFTVCSILNVNPLKYFPSLREKRCILPSHPLVMEMVRPIANCSICSAGKKGTPVIEFNHIPSKEEFLTVAYSSKPIIVRNGGTHIGMPKSFNFAKLKQVFESEPGGVDSVSDECQFLPFRSPFHSLREAFDLISDTATWDHPWYIGWSNCHPEVAAKLRQIFPRPGFLPEDSESSAIDWIFIGSPGLGAAMHIDYVRRPSWQAQLSGSKKWLLRPPPECESVCPYEISFRIKAGDLLFLETNTWYHETFIESNVLSISIGSEYD